MSKHTLTIEPPTPNSDDQEWSISCDEPGQCNGYESCRKYHGNARRNADDGPDSCDPEAPWADQEEFVFHGEVHTWHSGLGWGTAFPGCIVNLVINETGELPDELRYRDDEGFLFYRAGTYACEDEWYDESACLLNVLEVLA